MSLTHVLDKERHDEVVVTVEPSKLKNHVRTNVSEASVKCSTEALLLRCLAEEAKQILNDFSIGRFVGGVDAVFPHAVVLGKLDGLRPLAVASVDIGGDTTELQKLVGGKFGSKSNHVEVLELVDGLPQ